MSSARRRLTRTFAFGVGVLLVLVWLLLSGMVESRGPACSLGIGRPVYLPYQGASYGWPATAVQVGQVACQGSPEDWTPKPFVAWHANGVLISVAQLLAGGTLVLLFGGRLSRKPETRCAALRSPRESWLHGVVEWLEAPGWISRCASNSTTAQRRVK